MEVAPGQSLFLRGDIGGFSVGSRFSRQAVGGYLFNLGTWQGIEFAGVIGYRALSVDYTQGQGNRRYEFDMVQHGPLFGLSCLTRAPVGRSRCHPRRLARRERSGSWDAPRAEAWWT